MIRKPIYKLGKRLGAGIHEKCQTQKFALSDARFKKSLKFRKAMSDYGRQLIEKQRLRFAYGITEKQLQKYVKISMKSKDKISALFSILEMRLDNVIYSIGLAPTRRAARQMVSHGHIKVNGIKTTIPSHLVKIGDKISVRDESKDKTIFSIAKEEAAKHNPPKWLSFNNKDLSAQVKALPEFSSDASSFFDFKAVFEFYSR